MQRSLFLALALATLTLVLAPSAHAQDDAPPQTGPAQVGLVVRPIGGADQQLAEDIENILLSSIKGRDDAVNVKIITKADFVAKDERFNDDKELTACLLDAACAHGLLEKHNLRAVLWGKIEEDPQYYTFTAETHVPYTKEPQLKVMTVPRNEDDEAGDAVNAMLDKLYALGASIPLTPPKDDTKNVTPPDDNNKTTPDPTTPTDDPFTWRLTTSIVTASLAVVGVGLGVFFNSRAAQAFEDAQTSAQNPAPDPAAHNRIQERYDDNVLFERSSYIFSTTMLLATATLITWELLGTEPTNTDTATTTLHLDATILPTGGASTTATLRF